MMIYAINNENIKSSYYIKLYPQLNQYFNSRSAALLIDRLEYWFARVTQSGFYKFLEPCDHKGYRPGQSWCEEINIGRITFNKIFALIGIRYKSKSEFIAAQKAGDPFQGKLYLSYYDRKRNQMYFQRNHVYADQFLQDLFKPNHSAKRIQLEKDVVEKPKPSSFSQKQQKLSSIPTTLSTQQDINTTINNDTNDHSRNDTDCRSSYIQRNTYKSSSIKAEAPMLTSIPNTDQRERGEKMFKIWVEEVGHCTLSRISLSLANRMTAFLKSSLNNCLQAWRTYCRKIASSKFLMGEISQTFKAWLPWVIKQPTFEKIESGEFTLGDRELKQTTGQQQDYRALVEANIAQQPTEEDEAFHRQLLAHAGMMTYRNWLQNLKIIRIKEQTIYLQTSSSFIAQRIENAYSSVVIRALQILFKDVQLFRCEIIR